MENIRIALEVLDQLMEDKKAELNCRHYSVRYSAEIKIDSISRVKIMLEEKILNENSDIDEYDMMEYLDELESFE